MMSDNMAVVDLWAAVEDQKPPSHMYKGTYSDSLCAKASSHFLFSVLLSVILLSDGLFISLEKHFFDLDQKKSAR